MAKTAIYIASTGKNVGKTSLSIGLIGYLREQGYKVAFMKPMGQRYKTIDGKKISEDVLLISQTFNLDFDLSLMSPFIVERGIT
ncbi:MAG TPA: cobyrinic acid a,c-diamide synthase, partial [candidate division WOR-3 bacterium]|nr:cobyrinic acid a,c-diamide synthase [candidate division WOR-3 bacterium]